MADVAGPPRRRRLLLIGVAIGLAFCAVVLLWRRDIDAPTAARLADRLRAQYSHGSGEGLAMFAPREDARWADGWEFRWRYRPCPERASLRIWISRDGRRASYAELPACDDGFGTGRAPLKV
ncbi:hypothetical protein [Polymorphobacter fuscus]|uniref:Uncharacterized protein n=1 Tax=Sandarakinorhabdus fusca TaxID=1439888 RepID=A0A7C9KXX5_9SPHN|nr:hypothetical protein [Polymorphobacter fuscus]KAB7645457.1 hypothetical protein F9290_11500 [Polymorphobacter fuscus]MQT17882.1 hypothetical protein [Polymorphobacter fuscus]NJC08511.1 hypothetical protein [Polymorphobacter fuscus]